jgi:hypothetical protein
VIVLVGAVIAAATLRDARHRPEAVASEAKVAA